MSGIVLTGLRAENPLAFLAAIGALSLIDEGSNTHPRLTWEVVDGTWVPKLLCAGLNTPQDVVEAIAAVHEQRDLTAELGWENDVMKITRERLRLLLEERPPDSEAARLLAACVAELPLRRDRVSVPYTPFRLMPRVGRARFLATALRESQAGLDHLESCLFEEWRYAPDTQSMRWDPGARIPARALMAEAPTHTKPNGVPGAILLAIRGLASFPLIIRRYSALPPGMIDRRSFVWPIWSEPLELRVVRLLLSMPWLYELDDVISNDARLDTRSREIHSDRELRRQARHRANVQAQLRAHGVVATFSAQRVRRGEDDEAFGWGIPRPVEVTSNPT